MAVVRLPDGVVAVKRLVRREPDGGWWVERDNVSVGVDSWTVGALPDGALIAVVVARIPGIVIGRRRGRQRAVRD